MMNNNFATFFMVLTFLALSVVDAADSKFDLETYYDSVPEQRVIEMNVGDQLNFVPKSDGKDAHVYQLKEEFTDKNGNERTAKQTFKRCRINEEYSSILLPKNTDSEFVFRPSESGTYYLANAKNCEKNVKFIVTVKDGDGGDGPGDGGDGPTDVPGDGGGDGGDGDGDGLCEDEYKEARKEIVDEYKKTNEYKTARKEIVDEYKKTNEYKKARKVIKGTEKQCKKVIEIVNYCKKSPPREKDCNQLQPNCEWDTSTNEGECVPAEKDQNIKPKL